MSARLRRFARRSIDRVLKPHFDVQVASIDRLLSERLESAGVAELGKEDGLILPDFNHLLHELRTIELRRLPVDGGVLLSAGCAGGWYFQWLDECAGPFERHIGVELYSERPPGLPENVTWISQSASEMTQVQDASVDVIFSGQNLEHLWVDDMVGFVLEARRVLRPGGWLVVDSPNRLVTEALEWSHPEHTIELAVDEAVGLFELAGFDVVEIRGLWNCRDARRDAWLPLACSNLRELLDRSVGRRALDDNFVWWIEARRSDRQVDVDAVDRRVRDLFEQHWTRRVNRVAVHVGRRRADGGCSAAGGVSGLVYRTWGLPVFAGQYVLTASHPELRVRLLDGGGEVIAEGIGEARGETSSTVFGAYAELVLDAPIDQELTDLAVEVELVPARPA